MYGNEATQRNLTSLGVSLENVVGHVTWLVLCSHVHYVGTSKNGRQNNCIACFSVCAMLTS